VAKHIITSLIDDIDGSQADETVTFALDGISFEIDLNEKNAAALREFLLPYQQAGRKLARTPGYTHTKAVFRTPENNRIREWAKRHNIELADRGRIPQRVVDEYHASLSAPKPQPVTEPAPKKRIGRGKAPAAEFQAAEKSNA
jgi:hypothetical protein